MPSDQPLLPGIAPPRPRQMGRRCLSKHRNAWALSGGWLWCPDCGAIAPNERPKMAPHKWAVRWAYPGNTAKAGELDKRWAEQRKAITATQAGGGPPV